VKRKNGECSKTVVKLRHSDSDAADIVEKNMHFSVNIFYKIKGVICIHIRHIKTGTDCVFVYHNYQRDWRSHIHMKAPRIFLETKTHDTDKELER
jgi:hypothetical protein